MGGGDFPKGESPARNTAQMIPEYVIDQILSKDIVSIIGGEGVSLKRAGVNYECCCPFHKEKTPSFKVSPVKGIFTCF